ncbi:hypothetical protein ACOQFO_12905 [Ureibacillus sp. MALMAid1270]|uniref:hypothetical protein n=1 Tax=Ureibacillus sp. MALMAid1270 TaxID=3411629 RepID=UPI003BA4CB6B
MSNDNKKDGTKRFSDKVSLIAPYLVITLLAFNLFFLIYISNSSQTKEKMLLNEIHNLNEHVIQLEKVVTDEEKNSIQSNSKDETIDFLESQYDKYFEFADKDRASFFDLVNLFFVALGVLVTGAIVVVYWLFGQSREEVRKNADREIENSLAGLKVNAEQKLQELINPKITEYEDKLKEFTRMLNNNYKLKNSEILIISNENQIDNLAIELQTRAKAIVKKAEIHPVDLFDKFQEFIVDKKMDMIIYMYEENYEDENHVLEKYLELLIEKDSRIPLIVYTGFKQLKGDNLNLANKYPYSTFANMQTTLTTSIISLSNIISYERKDEDDC